MYQKLAPNLFKIGLIFMLFLSPCFIEQGEIFRLSMTQNSRNFPQKVKLACSLMEVLIEVFVVTSKMIIMDGSL